VENEHVENAFADLVARLRSGDPEAATEFVRKYEPVIRLEIQMGLRDSRLRRAFDASDVCQSVLASFFIRAAAGQYELDSQEGLAGLLIRMARNKLASQARRYTNTRRDVRRDTTPEVEPAVAGVEPSPSRQIEWRELLQRFREHLTEDERVLADARAQGKAWAEIATELGGDARVLSKRLERAVDRVCAELGLEDE
jgi:RNA polymerase sigma-70 factor (ECF subfamily)